MSDIPVWTWPDTPEFTVSDGPNEPSYHYGPSQNPTPANEQNGGMGATAEDQ